MKQQDTHQKIAKQVDRHIKNCHKSDLQEAQAVCRVEYWNHNITVSWHSKHSWQLRRGKYTTVLTWADTNFDNISSIKDQLFHHLTCHNISCL